VLTAAVSMMVIASTMTVNAATGTLSTSRAGVSSALLSPLTPLSPARQRAILFVWWFMAVTVKSNWFW
jgi:hypothetical protein